MQEMLNNDQPNDAIKPPSNVDDMIMGYVDGTEGSAKELEKAQKKQLEENKMNAKRMKFLDKLIVNEKENKPDSNFDNLFSCR